MQLPGRCQDAAVWAPTGNLIHRSFGPWGTTPLVNHTTGGTKNQPPESRLRHPISSPQSMSPLDPQAWEKTWLCGLSFLEALSLLTSEARVVLTPVRNARFVVSLTTSPKRVGKLRPVIESLQRNSLKPDVIIVNLPYVFLRDGSTFGRLPDFLTSDPGVLVNWCDDVGPATKILAALPLVSGPDDVIITVDDDIWYPPHQLKKLFLSSLENPGKVVTGKSALPGFMVEGFSGVVYRRSFFGDPEALAAWIKAAPMSCFLADDYVLSNYLLNRQLSIVTCNTRAEGRLLRRLRLGPIPLEHGLQSDALHLGADRKCKGNRENYAKCRQILESEGLLFSGFPDTSDVYYDEEAFPGPQYPSEKSPCKAP